MSGAHAVRVARKTAQALALGGVAEPFICCSSRSLLCDMAATGAPDALLPASRRAGVNAQLTNERRVTFAPAASVEKLQK